MCCRWSVEWWKGRNVIEVLRERGLIQDVTSPDIETLCGSKSVSVYCGFDPTADSLHLGNLLGILVLSWFQRCGHQPVALIGGATGRVGDPSGKSAERPVLAEEQIEANLNGIRGVLVGLLQAGGEPKVVNNLDWFGPMGFLEFLRTVGKAARVGTMMSKDSVKTRMASETGISYTEFTYQLLQGYDFVHLNRTMGVEVQIGGSDQWGNITAGTELLRKLSGFDEEDTVAADGAEAPTAYGLTFPLLTDASGKKFGKSEGGAIWLTADKVSPYQFYQHLFQTTDADVIKFLRMLTFLPMDEIDAIEAAMSQEGYKPNTAQRRLAEEVTRFVHGEAGLRAALKATEGLRPGSDTKLDAEALEALAQSGDVPCTELSRAEVVGRPVVDVLVEVGLQKSKSAARKMVQGGGIRLNNERVGDVAAEVGDDDVLGGKLVLLAAGKKNKMIVRIA
ncbi:unnamed protein product [Pedinophyceae sp. YPF-701]|nr:unnamed protein product [Pedinophyceae sp. YPF-701]